MQKKKHQNKQIKKNEKSLNWSLQPYVNVTDNSKSKPNSIFLIPRIFELKLFNFVIICVLIDWFMQKQLHQLESRAHMIH